MELENTLKDKISKAEKVTLLAESKLEEFISKISEKRDAEEGNGSRQEKKENHHKRVSSNKEVLPNEQKFSEIEDELISLLQQEKDEKSRTENLKRILNLNLL